MSKKPKRPRDANQLAKMMIDIASGDVSLTEPKGENSQAAKRGKARTAALTSEQRATIAKLAAQARWKKSR